MHKAFKEILFSEEEIQLKVEEMAKKISNDYRNCKEPIVMIGVLKGCLPFFSDLVKKIDIDIRIDYIEASSWNGGLESSGNVKVTKEINTNLEGKNIIIVEDIIDSGITLEKILDFIRDQNPNSMSIATLLDKPSGRDKSIDIKVDYSGFIVPDAFLIGYGLDYKEIYRNVPYVGIIKPEYI